MSKIGEQRITQILFQIAPHPRQIIEITALAVAKEQTGENAPDLGVALRHHRHLGAELIVIQRHAELFRRGQIMRGGALGQSGARRGAHPRPARSGHRRGCPPPRPGNRSGPPGQGPRVPAATADFGRDSRGAQRRAGFRQWRSSAACQSARCSAYFALALPGVPAPVARTIPATGRSRRSARFRHRHRAAARPVAGIRDRCLLGMQPARGLPPPRRKGLRSVAPFTSHPRRARRPDPQAPEGRAAWSAA